MCVTFLTLTMCKHFIFSTNQNTLSTRIPSSLKTRYSPEEPIVSIKKNRSAIPFYPGKLP